MTTRVAVFAVVLAGLLGPAALARQDVPMAAVVDVPSKPVSVTVYLGRAAVTRSTQVSLAPGLHALRFAALPSPAMPQTLQARVRGPARVLGVDELVASDGSTSSPRILELERMITQLEVALEDVERERAIVTAEERLVDAVGVRATGDATASGGTDRLDLDRVREQLAFVRGERERLLEAGRTLDTRERGLQEELRMRRSEREAIAGRGTAHRIAVVTVAVSSAATIEVELSYLVTDATWEPVYNFRADPDGSGVVLEYDAMVTQRTGEDWNDVAFTLSTAQPTQVTHPPDLEPWFLDIVRPPAPMRRSTATATARPPASAGLEIEALSQDAAVAGAGPSITFDLPRRVSVASDRQRRHRTRIATIEAQPRFLHVATPLAGEEVYVRGAITNTSVYPLLPGPASIFVGQDYVGPTRLEGVAPGAEFDLYFGVDRLVTARRERVLRETNRTGLLGGGLRTSSVYRIEIDNHAGKTILLELWDRIPVTRSDQIAVELIGLTYPLDTEPEYLDTDRLEGLLRWTLSIPMTGEEPFVVEYEVRVTHAKEVTVTPLPE